MKKVCWPYFDPEFDTLRERIYGPPCRVCIDNESIVDCTVVKVDSLNNQGLLLEVVQVLTDLNLIISKSYISSDAGWFMDVFHVKDEFGNKLTDPILINRIQQAIGTTREKPNPTKTNACINNALEQSSDHTEHTAIEMTGTDRPGLFSEISAALADLHCNILEVHAWSHNACLACIAYVSDQSTHARIDDPNRLATIEDHLTMVLRTTADPASSATHIGPKESMTGGYLAAQGTAMMNTNVERRLHQLMLSVRDFDGPHGPRTFPPASPPSASFEKRRRLEMDGDERLRKTMVSIENCKERRYSIVTIRCKDRRRLMFDTVCTLIDMQYVIFHASLGSNGAYAFQEYFIRHVDGRALNTESEKERIIKCLEAAIERRVCEGVKLEFCADNRAGLLSDITRVLRENGLTVARADVTTLGEKAMNALYIRDISGNKIDMELVESVKREMGPIDLAIKNDNIDKCPKPRLPERHRFSLGDMLRSQIERLSLNLFQPSE